MRVSAKISLPLMLALVCLGLSPSTLAQNNSVLASGDWIKLEIEEAGVYKVSYNDIIAYGLSGEDINPENIKLYGNGSGMLPQPNDSSRAIDLQEVSIQVKSAQANIFQSGDYLLFYAEGPDYYSFDPILNTPIYQKHLFSTKNYYYLTIGTSSGSRILTDNQADPGAPLTTGHRFDVHEEELFNILHSGREWFGEKFDLEITQTFNSSLTGLQPETQLNVISSVMSASTDDASFDVSLNGSLLGTQIIQKNPNTQYGRKGRVKTDNFSINTSDINTSPLELTYKFNKESGVGYLNYFIVHGECKLEYSNSPLQFYLGDYAKAGNRTATVTNCPVGLQVWDITDHNNAVELNYSQVDDAISFNLSEATESIIVFNPQNLSAPEEGEPLENQNLRSIGMVDLVIVSPAEYTSSAAKIAELRESEGLKVSIVTPEQIYNEFSSGKPDITAIRDFAKHLYDNADLKYLFLFGKGTYDPKDIIGSDYNKVPMYQSRSSLLPLSTYGSDDYLGFLEDHEGYWEENSVDDHTLDIGVGRIPIRNIDEAERYVAKLKTYENRKSIGAWRKDVVFVAENGDINIHQRDAEKLATLIDTTFASFNSNKIYVDAYPIEVNPGSTRAPQVNEAIYDAISSGALIVNYTGHGNESQWANTRIFDKRMIDSLENDIYYPLFVTATCEFGRHDDTGQISGAEELILKKSTGAIASITTTRPVFASSNYQLNLAFYNTVFERIDGQYQRLGDVFIKTKNNSLNGVLNRNFSLLGDPSMKLAYGEQFILLDSLNGEALNAADTLASLKEMRFSGRVVNESNLTNTNFNGEVDIKLYDKVRVTKTLGNQDGAPFTYKIRDNVLFSGSATIKQGEFSFTTILPVDISYNPSDAKIVLYAAMADSSLDASGANIDLLVGNSADTPIIDVVAPEIDIFLGDTTFREGQIVSPNTLLIARFYDENGINTSASQIGHAITYQLDNNDPVTLNEFYKTEKDNFKKGWVYFNLPKLAPGGHIITVTAWDTSNNSSTKSLEFYVSQDGEVIISDLSNYPNPVVNQTNFTFAHNISGEDLDITLEVMNTAGQLVYRETRSYLNAPSVINDWEWDGRNQNGAKLNEGIYIFGVFVRSTSNNLSQNQYSRLFLTN
jgi:hypothetical protein